VARKVLAIIRGLFITALLIVTPIAAGVIAYRLARGT
jgi:hypothetical protein